jgi:septal ring factor EnvC (AmiA/AmiB activator)
MAAGALLAPPAVGKPAKKGQQVEAPAVPTARPRADRQTASDGPAIDLSHALPAKSLAKLPSSTEQLKSLTDKLAEGAPDLAAAREQSQSLADAAAALKQKLIATAARIESLERQAADDGTRIAALSAQYESLIAGFRRDRISVTRLLAVLERLQHDMPPALALRPGDALGAARGAMLVGASLPPLYARAAALSRRIEALVRTRTALEDRRRDAADTAARLTAARADLDRLLAQKEKEAEGAAGRYGTLKTQLAAIARQAADFQALMKRVKALRRGGDDPGQGSIVTVGPAKGESFGGLTRNSLLVPVVGTRQTAQRASDPGLTYATAPRAQVIAPADGKVLFAGPYRKAGQVLILEITTGYDLVLAGLGRVTVKPGDQLLAGEPVGTMPVDSQEGGRRLYFELRRDGKGQSPVPWLRAELRKANGT